ncbi:hypothetical protein CDL12_18461 [Handroanthus impetiginosus]|uniref:CASP-like protein n=1 Tax=Handroanthus impetiginosus TaxID=429701 RepID=A0A2G9GUL2_9LAMI|nr:hypothetical protein CDL12_18461 [Handroanthus impetiginosus]
MEGLPGAPATGGSVVLRFGQAIFAAISLLCMCLDIEFYGSTAFCFLVTIMGLVIPWSLACALVDALSIYAKRPIHAHGIHSIILVGDWVLSYLSLAASCSVGSASDVLGASGQYSFCIGKVWARYQLGAAMAFLSWSLLFASFLFNLWLLPSL